MRTRKKYFKIIIFISLFCFISYFGIIAKGIYGWDKNPLIIPAGSSEPTLDGIKGDDEDWYSEENCNTSIQIAQNGFPDATFYAFTRNNYLFIMIEIKITNPNDDQYVKILLSNSSASEDNDFIDAKLIQNRNLTQDDNRTFYIEDQVLVDGNYVNDTSINFEGAANISGPNKYTYYEFKIPFALINDDKINDTSIYGGGATYAVKIEYGVAPEGHTATQFRSPVLTLQIGIPPEEGDESIGEFKIDIELVSNIMFIVAGIAFAVIFIITLQGRSKIE
ncbi:MAG: hypothetical protein ACTSO9_00030 [Candidatus Helarchaeota archaeon]